MFSAIRRHLAWKLFLSYLIVIIVGVLVLAATTEIAIPSSFQRHLAAMSSMMGGSGMEMEANLFSNFRSAVNEAMSLAALAAVLVAVAASLLFSRQIVAPVRQMEKVSQRIAEGHYEERVEIPGSLDPSEMDELDSLGVSFNQMAAKLDQTETMRRQLIGDIAHELRTPLSTIKAAMEGLIDGVLPARPETYQEVIREADRMQRLVHDLQELSRVEAGAYTLERDLHSIQSLVQAAKVRLEKQYQEKGVGLRLDLPSSLPQVWVDESRIQQVLLNVLGNALQYTPRGGQVRVEADPTEGQVAIRVHDTGRGIPPEHLKYIFNRFYRVDKSRSRAGGGSGIGLTIARHLVEAHGGRIWAESPGLDQGSTFSFTLPASEQVGSV
ncbi:MAG: sensor histidine kinase [Anaerolineales bacterium]